VAYFKCVCFGPIVKNEMQEWYEFQVRSNYVYKLSFVGKRSKCPGFATLKEKPAGFKRNVKGEYNFPKPSDVS